MITPRRTRLVRVPDLYSFRRAIAALCAGDCAERLIVVPTREAARQLRHTMTGGVIGADVAGTGEGIVTRDELYERLHARLPNAPRRLTAFDRDGIAQAAAIDAASTLSSLPFRVRPGLVAEMLRFYDQLRRQTQQVKRFEELIEQALGADGDAADRGAERMLRQTRFLARTFAEYERRIADCGACDEHTLRHRLMVDEIAPAVHHVVVTVADWIADPDGLFVADFDLLTRMPRIEAIDLVCTEALLESGFHERVHRWLPGLEEVEASQLFGSTARIRPVLVVSPDGTPDQPWFTYRDREEELVAVARQIGRPEGLKYDSSSSDSKRTKANSRSADLQVRLDRTAVIFKRPLPYLYLAPATLGAAGIPYQTSDALPLAAEPAAAAMDLVLDLVETRFARDAIVALLGTPHFRFLHLGQIVSREAIDLLDRALSEHRYLGDLRHLESLAAQWNAPDVEPAMSAALIVCRELAPLVDPAPASEQLGRLLSFLTINGRPLEAHDPFAPRERRARAAIAEILTGLGNAHRAHDDPLWTIDELAAAVRRWIEDETFAPESAGTGVHLLDDRAARYGDFDQVAIVGLIDSEWPERPRRNIFYPPNLLKALGWPSERDRRAAADAHFLDLLASASQRTTLSTITLDEDALVARSIQLDEVPQARLSTVPQERDDDETIFPDEALAASSPEVDALGDSARMWAELRIDRPPAEGAEFHGSIGPQIARRWSVSALETYLACPFKFYAQHVLSLEEEPEDEEVMDPRRQGRFVHQVFEIFFAEWQRARGDAITPQNLDAARAMFAAIVDRELERLPRGEAGLERTRLLGSPAAAGIGEAVLRMEAERPTPVVERLLEHSLQGQFVIATAAGPRGVELRGKADRIDLLADGSFRLIDYKLGWPPNRARALQLPIYGLCAEQQLARNGDQRWTLGEAVYLAFKGPKRVVPLFASAADRDKVLADAQQRLADTLDAIERGDFPPAPDDVYRCETCSFASVCRKDYVGEV